MLAGESFLWLLLLLLAQTIRINMQRSSLLSAAVVEKLTIFFLFLQIRTLHAWLNVFSQRVTRMSSKSPNAVRHTFYICCDTASRRRCRRWWWRRRRRTSIIRNKLDCIIHRRVNRRRRMRCVGNLLSMRRDQSTFIHSTTKWHEKWNIIDFAGHCTTNMRIKLNGKWQNGELCVNFEMHYHCPSCSHLAIECAWAERRPFTEISTLAKLHSSLSLSRCLEV